MGKKFVIVKFGKWWIVFASYFIVGLLFWWSDSRTFNQLQVEIIGAFLGVFGALIFTKAIEDSGQFLNAKILKSELLRDIQHLRVCLLSDSPLMRLKDPKTLYPIKNFMRFEIASQQGELTLFDKSAIEDFNLVSIAINSYNRCVKDFNDCLENQDISKGLYDVLRTRALSDKTALLSYMDLTLKKYGIIQQQE